MADLDHRAPLRPCSKASSVRVQACGHARPKCGDSPAWRALLLTVLLRMQGTCRKAPGSTPVAEQHPPKTPVVGLFEWMRPVHAQPRDGSTPAARKKHL